MTRQAEIVAEFKQTLENELDKAEATLGNKAVKIIKEAFIKGSREIQELEVKRIIGEIDAVRFQQDEAAHSDDNLHNAACAGVVANVLEAIVLKLQAPSPEDPAPGVDV